MALKFATQTWLGSTEYPCFFANIFDSEIFVANITTAITKAVCKDVRHQGKRRQAQRRKTEKKKCRSVSKKKLVIICSSLYKYLVLYPFFNAADCSI